MENDLKKFRNVIEQYKNGSITYDVFRKQHVPMGIYDERQPGNYMLRVRLAAGVIFPNQMRTIAAVSKKYGDGFPHVTTRQDFQIHAVRIDGMYDALVELSQAGLSTRGGGGDTVRNITSCPGCKHQVFEVTPYAIFATDYLLGQDNSFDLPRKFKVAFSACSKDCAAAVIHDVGFIAKRQNGADGFRVYVGGGLGARSRMGDVLEDFLPADEFHLTIEAVKRVFHTHGDRSNRKKARLRFLIDQIGIERFRQLYDVELSAMRGQKNPLPDGRGSFKRNDASIEFPLLLGVIDSDTLLHLADVAEFARATVRQNLILFGVDSLPVKKQPDIVSCTGAATCRLGLCDSRKMAKAISDKLLENGFPANVKINISGCPNCCGRHNISPIGLMGCVRNSIPHYIIHLGGKIGEGENRFGVAYRTVAENDVPDFLASLLKDFARSKQYPDFYAFVDSLMTIA